MLPGPWQKSIFVAILLVAMLGQRVPTRERRNRAPARRLLAFITALAAVGAGHARAVMAEVERDVMVVLLRPVPTEPLLAESIVRIKSELLAGDFEVVVVDTPASELVP